MANKKSPIRITGERELSFHLSNLEHHEKIAQICKALSSPVRLQILNVLKASSMSVQEIAGTLDIPVSSTALYIKTLEEAGLVATESQPGKHGSMRVCTCIMHSLYLQTFDIAADSMDNTLVVDMPIGNFYECNVSPTCGLADEDGIINAYDNIKSFYSPRRLHAQLLWFHKGHIEYRFPNISNPLLKPYELSFSMEICSEAPGYHEHWPSDITIFMNDIELLTYHAPGDYGARRGKLTPSAWANGRTQYGLLKSFSLRDDGGYLDGQRVNSLVCLEQIKLQEKPYISLKIEIKDSAKYIGGINIFGETYGDHPQGIVMRLSY